MVPEEELRTTLSTKGQVILPKRIRRSRRWDAGTQLIVEDTAAGVLLRPIPTFPRTDPEQVFGCLPFSGRPKTLDEMDAGVMATLDQRLVRSARRCGLHHAKSLSVRGEIA